MGHLADSPGVFPIPGKGFDISSFEFTEGSGIETANTTGFTKGSRNVDTSNQASVVYFCKCKTLGSETGYRFCLFKGTL